jgi:hypothetical protein
VSKAWLQLSASSNSSRHDCSSFITQSEWNGAQQAVGVRIGRVAECERNSSNDLPEPTVSRSRGTVASMCPFGAFATPGPRFAASSPTLSQRNCTFAYSSHLTSTPLFHSTTVMRCLRLLPLVAVLLLWLLRVNGVPVPAASTPLSELQPAHSSKSSLKQQQAQIQWNTQHGEG